MLGSGGHRPARPLGHFVRVTVITSLVMPDSARDRSAIRPVRQSLSLNPTISPAAGLCGPPIKKIKTTKMVPSL
jgi:hypothetical protein